MSKKYQALLLILLSAAASGQERSLKSLLSDPVMSGASFSGCILDAKDGTTVWEYNSGESLIPASVLKVVTSAAALDLLGPEYSFLTRLGYTGSLKKKTGVLSGDIIIQGGGDPSLGSPYFTEHYGSFLSAWIQKIKESGIKTINGRVICDDSRYDYQPVPSGWLWEDIGNYYGAGVYGLSLFDNTFHIHFRTSAPGSVPEITGFVPDICRYDISNQLVSYGNTDMGYVFYAPYGSYGWIAGSIPANREDFVLKASIPDPPLLMARLFDRMLDSAGIEVAREPSTSRIENTIPPEMILLDEVESPPLVSVIEVLNHESVNLYAEHLLKEIGLQFKGKGTTRSGIQVLYSFLQDAGCDTSGFFIEDGSGLSPLNAVTSKGLSGLMLYMLTKATYPEAFLNSLPEAGKEGTLKSAFRNPAFYSNLKAKSGSFARTRSYTGYFTARSGRKMAFSILVNNFSGPSQTIVAGIEAILLETLETR
ncbi:MAG: D-alanyl-D-alanine carboxypeptidase/D-alanyl-D-alanine-endopeptidase [Bacteroidales bacterium]|jgi:D-alanyl-D-alanine carboxypeptidase/D-alanyl-D-alanine-endopeptidase (penicillin-binding protein 4)|nr:D-alanyl-D-alanine carboxypeptidase/D-alanyl-D-alanine-endopeptidase [Bacteroidales bacterium]